MAPQTGNSGQTGTSCAAVIAYQLVGNPFHKLQAQKNIPCFYKGKDLVDFFCISLLCRDAYGRIIGIRVFPCFFHKQAVKLDFQKTVGNPPLVVHLVYKRMAGGIQKIMAAKTKKIGKQGLILGLTHLTHSLDEKGSGFFLMHPVSNAADMIFENKIIKMR